MHLMLTRYLQDKGYRYDEINAVLATWQGYIADVRERCEALKGFRGKPEFVKLVIGQKRVRNILKDIDKVAAIDNDLIQEPAEKALLKIGNQTSSEIETLIAQKSYPKVLTVLLEMRPVIDRFFDDVLVMCGDKKLRENRMALVSIINRLFLQFADFSQIVIEGEKTQR